MRRVFTGPSVVAIGVFDAVHRGHAKLLKAARQMADRLGAKLYVCTFDPHPDVVLGKKNGATKWIYPKETRVRLLEEEGVDASVFAEFDEKFASQSPEEFILRLKKTFPNLCGIVVGANFKFGSMGGGNLAWLKENSAKYGFETLGVEGEKDGEKWISSTRLRELLSAGEMSEFARLSGRPYFAEGKIAGGRRLGRELGFPTLNLPWNPECTPLFGVYAARLKNMENGRVFEGVASYGTNPTIPKTSPVLETHLLEAPDFGEGASVRVELLKFFRPEQKFASLDDLKKQIALDKLAAQKYFAKKG